MAGVKGRSGRRSFTDEQKRFRVIDKAWEVVEKFLNDENQPLKERVEVAKGIVVKNIPNEFTGGGGQPLIPPSIVFELNKHIENKNDPNITDVHASESPGSTEPEVKI